MARTWLAWVSTSTSSIEAEVDPVKHILPFLTVISLLLTAGCASEPETDQLAELDVFRTAVEAYHQGAMDVDPEAILALYAGEAQIIKPGREIVSTYEGVKAYVDGFTSTPGFEPSFSTREVHLSSDGTMGWSLADVTVSYLGESGERISESIRDFHVWRMGSDGAWRIVVDIWNDAPALETEE